MMSYSLRGRNVVCHLTGFFWTHWTKHLVNIIAQEIILLHFSQWRGIRLANRVDEFIYWQRQRVVWRHNDVHPITESGGRCTVDDYSFNGMGRILPCTWYLNLAYDTLASSVLETSHHSRETSIFKEFLNSRHRKQDWIHSELQCSFLSSHSLSCFQDC
jgi:hypothetical protein